jgi:hypothetical protein
MMFVRSSTESHHFILIRHKTLLPQEILDFDWPIYKKKAFEINVPV